MDKGKMTTRDKQTKSKTQQNVQNVDASNGNNRAGSPANASCNPQASVSRDTTEIADSTNTILAEIKSFRQDISKQLGDIKEEISKTKQRIDDMEERISNSEDRVQSVESVMEELIKLQAALEAKQTDHEGRDRRNNVRIYSVAEGSESGSPSMINFVEELLKQNLPLPAEMDLQIERAHRALGPAPREGAPPRSIIVKFLSYRVKEEILKTAWQKKGFIWKNTKINLDNDYAPSVLKKRQEYAEAKRVLKENGIRFQTPFPARLRVFYPEGTCIYNTAEEATKEMAEKGLKVTVLKPPETLLEQVRRMAWTVSGRRGQPQERKQQGSTYKDKLQRFSRVPPRRDREEM